ncbi:MAG: hypothetical protein MJ105_02380 [Lachnospiraceae bacterium]|nr:hypothetical protein [Lachnospiraceae bacterium]
MKFITEKSSKKREERNKSNEKSYKKSRKINVAQKYDYFDESLFSQKLSPDESFQKDSGI